MPKSKARKQPTRKAKTKHKPKRKSKRKPRKPQNGAGLYQDLMNKLIPRGDKLADGEIHPPIYTKDGWSKPRWLGPGSNYEDKIKRGLKPVTVVDRVARVHDARYAMAKSTADVRAADVKMVRKLKQLWKSGDDYKFNIVIAALPIATKMKLEDWGVFSKGSFANLKAGKQPKDPKMVADLIKRETQAGYGKKKKKQSGGGKSPWVQHVKAYQTTHGCSYKDAMKQASATYKRT